MTAAEREQTRRRWRAFFRPHWPTLRPLLSRTEARVLELRLGLASDTPMTQAQIARRLDLSAQTVSKYEAQAREKARALVTLERP